MSAAISIRQLAVTFPGGFQKPAVTALHPLDLTVERGAIVGILGPNGSGKTTLLRVLAGLQRETTGLVRVLDLPADATLVRQRVAYQPEGPLPLAVLTGREFLQWYGCELRLSDAVADQRAAELLARFQLANVAQRRVRTYSTGMQKRLALAAALLGEPEVLLLDEPTSGLDPLGSGMVIDVLRERAQRGTTIVMASHHLQEVEQICSTVLALHAGRCVARGTIDDLLGTGDRTLTVRGLPDSALNGVAEDLQRRGGELIDSGRVRQHLFAWFRRLGSGPNSGPQS
ncbi:MAG: ABC transporter ATP-binding protein [Planctomycetota bacterium]|nr:ABC transporter ATP-binding protein [Planctomycetota bacterium]MSR38769.1 ABC transporter ATP-binding protein [Planctomycetota bacterium]